MKEKNICKLIHNESQDRLETHRFIYETNVSAMQKTSALTHHRAILVKKGNLIFRIGNAKMDASAGSLLFAFSSEVFSADTVDNGEYVYVDFSGGRADELFKRFGINAGNRFFDGFDGLIPFWYDALVRASEETIDLAAESALLYALSKLNTTPNEQNTIIQQIICITEDNFNNPRLSITAIADELSYNSKYLSHLFKTKMGIGYTEYLRMHRIKYAIILIDHGIDSIKNIASLCGFSDPLYFSSIFKQIVGVSPSQYKTSKRE